MNKKCILLFSILLFAGCSNQPSVKDSILEVPIITNEPENWRNYCLGSEFNIAEEHKVKCSNIRVTLEEVEAGIKHNTRITTQSPEFESDAAQEQQYWENEEEYQNDRVKLYQNELNR